MPTKDKKTPAAKKPKKSKAAKEEKIEKQVAKASEAKAETKSEPKKETGRYFYAVGKRKTAVAQVKLYPESGENSKIEINQREMKNYFSIPRLINTVNYPLEATGLGKAAVLAKVSGGGIAAQAEAVRLGISRALIEFNPDFRKVLKSLGFLKRDSRKVERKKPGLKKARRAPQWAKR